MTARKTWITAVFLLAVFLTAGFSAVNRITITEKAGTATDNYPIQIGVPFLQGEIPAFPEALLDGTPVTTQADVKTRHSDGSVKHAVICFLIPHLAANSARVLTFRNQASGNNSGFLTKTGMLASGFNFDAVMDLTLGTVKSVSARTMLTDSSYQYWLKGSVTTSVILADHSLLRKYDVGTDTNRSVRPVFHATFWPVINKVSIRYIAEVSNTERLQDQTCAVTLKSGQTSPATIYTQGVFTHYAGSRWTKTAWIGGAPSKIDIRFNLPYLAATCATANYDTTKTVSSAALSSAYSSWQTASKALFDAGLWAKAMGMAGGRPDIGPYPTWLVQWFYTGDNRLLEVSAGCADLAAAWPMHFREGLAAKKLLRDDTISGLGRVMAITNRPSLSIGSGLDYSYTTVADRVKLVGAYTTGGWNPDDAHQPDPFSVLYALTGDFWYLEEMMFWAAFTAALPNGAATMYGYGRGPTGAEGGISSQVRGQAWGLRSRAQTAFFAPDSLPEKRYFTQLMIDAASKWEGEHDLSGSPLQGNATWTWAKSLCIPSFGVPTLHQWSDGGTAFVQDPLDAAVCLQGISTWEQNFLMYALGRAKELGFPFGPLVSYLSVNIIGQATAAGYNHYLMGAYRLPTVRKSDSKYFDTWPNMLTGYQAATQTVSSFSKSDGDHGYDFIAMAATAMAANEPGGDSAWAFVKRELLGTALLNDNPKWAITPRPAGPSVAETPDNPETGAAAVAAPNPFNPATTLTFTTKKSRIRLVIYDVAGRVVRTLADKALSAGTYRFNWDGRNDRNAPVSGGLYVAKLMTGDQSRTLKLVYLK